MKKIGGVAAFGLNDTVARTDGECREAGFFLADAVTPQSPLGPIRTGEEAEEERVHSGLDWPKEARITLGEPLRRVPIPCAWALLVEAGDTTARWASATGGSFPLAAILAEHVRTLFKKGDEKYSDADEVVIAIPDHLDEYGQEALLREYRHRAQTPAQLVWRPVAAALAWLDQVQATLGPIGENDWMAVYYLGADAIECVGFRLQVREHMGGRYVLPVRERPMDKPGSSGADWAVDAMQSLLGLGTNDPGAFWQAFTVFPEIWQAMAGRAWKTSELPRAWSKGGGWEEWSPPPTLARELPDVLMSGGTALWKILARSNSMKRIVPEAQGKRWKEYLEEKTARLVRQMGRSKLRGAIVCGPLTPRTPVSWLDPFGLQMLIEPKPDTLWLTAGHDDPIAAGARLYGQRLANKLPTYLDTLPQIATLALAQYEYTWIDLVKATTCDGGEPYTNELKGQFKLQRECDWVEVYLKREMRDDSGSEMAGQSRAPYRKGKMRFPSAPAKDTVLDLKVEMRPASGLAQVEFAPRQREFLRGRRVFFDYARMEDAYELPHLKRGWPEVLKMPLTNDPNALVGQRAIDNFLSSTVHGANYVQELDGAQKALAGQWKDFQSGKWTKRINEDGRAGSSKGQDVVTKLQQKIEADFVELKSKGPDPVKQEKIVIRGSWLWGGTPQALSGYLESFFRQVTPPTYPSNWRYFVEAASRCFTDEQQFKLLFGTVHKRLLRPGTGTPFPLQASRSVYRVLMYRENAPAALTEDQAIDFLRESIKVIQREVSSCKIKDTFFQGVLLFFVLLRYRKINSRFMDPDVSPYGGVFEKIEKLLEQGKACVHTRQPNAKSRIDKLLNGIMAYMRFEGSPGIIELLAQEAGY